MQSSLLIKGLVILLGLVGFLLVGMFVDFHPTGSAGGLVITELQPATQTVGTGTAKPPELTKGIPAETMATTPSIWPTGGTVTSRFGWRPSPWGEGNEWHPGIDIANGAGTPIVATADGEIVQSELWGGYGNLIQIDHGNGTSTVYGHNSKLLAKVGQHVKKGQVIAYMGNTGKSTGPHLHYEIRVNGTAVDPIHFLIL